MARFTTTLPSGSKLDMNIAPWGVVGNLRRILATEAKRAGLNVSSSVVGALKSGNKKKALDSVLNEEMTMLINLVLGAAASEELETAIFDCFSRCTLNGKKITPQLFDEEQDLRRDYYPAAGEVIKLNILPFFEALASKSTPETKQSDETAAPA